MTQRKLLTVVLYTILVLFIGRNLTFLPTWQGLSKEKDFSETLRSIAEEKIADKKGSFSIYYKSFATDKDFEINSQMIHTAASVNKVPIIVALYQEAEKGNLELNEQITIQKSDIQDYGTGVLRYQEPGQTYSLRSLAKLALKQSDNTAAHILKNRVGENVVENSTNAMGLTQTSIIENITSPKDMGILFEKLYNGELLSEANTTEVLSFLKDTDIEDRLSKNLEGAIVYHKTGDEVGTVHDVGIIEKNGTVFYLGVMISDVGGKEAESKNIISDIARGVTSYVSEHK